MMGSWVMCAAPRLTCEKRVKAWAGPNLQSTLCHVLIVLSLEIQVSKVRVR